MPPKKKLLPKQLHKHISQKIQQTSDQPKAKHTFSPLTSIFGCSAHPQKFLKLQTNNKNLVFCKSCGSKIFGQHGYLTCTITACFFLCSSCKICRENHFLGKVYGFKQNDGNEKHVNNEYCCGVCHEEKELDLKVGVHHCMTCDYTICPECMEHEKKLWVK